MEYDLAERTMRFALDVTVLCRQFPDNPEGRHVRGQLFRAASGLAANYRAACRGRSKRDFVAKLGTAVEEGDEADFWLDFGVRAGLLTRGTEAKLRREADELVRILVKSRATARENLRKAKRTAGVLLIALLPYVLYTFLT